MDMNKKGFLDGNPVLLLAIVFVVGLGVLHSNANRVDPCELHSKHISSFNQCSLEFGDEGGYLFDACLYQHGWSGYEINWCQDKLLGV